jgi:hypothetical protein
MGGFQQQVVLVVVGHLAPGPHTPIEALADALELFKEGGAIVVVEKDIGPGVTTCHDVIERAFVLDA